jgi:RNA polymerase sigma-70 factor (ECF subfamily)
MILANHSAAEDAVQQVFVKMIKMKNHILKIESYDSYLTIAIRNQCYEMIKKGKRLKLLTENSQSKPIIEPISETETNHQERQLLENAIKKLSPQQREVLHMKVYENKTFSQISKNLNLSINTIASRYRYALEKLKELL